MLNAIMLNVVMQIVVVPKHLALITDFLVLVEVPTGIVCLWLP